MAVGRVKAHRKWHLAAAKVMEDWSKCHRELMRAAISDGPLDVRYCELQSDEMRELQRRMPGDPLVVEAIAVMEVAELGERTRLRPGDLIQRRHEQRRGNLSD